jgi:hypothetical protein
MPSLTIGARANANAPPFHVKRPSAVVVLIDLAEGHRTVGGGIFGSPATSRPVRLATGFAPATPRRGWRQPLVFS